MNTSKCDVFVSFRGEDTRHNFTSPLFAAFQRKGTVALKDETELAKGYSIVDNLLRQIKESQILIVVLSKRYASSTWCLRELAEIVRYIGVPGKRVLPIFYHVSPSEVRNQTGQYEQAFVEHEERFKEDIEKMAEVQRWRDALTQLANLNGFDAGYYRNEKELIEQVTELVESSNARVYSFTSIVDAMIASDDEA